MVETKLLRCARKSLRASVNKEDFIMRMSAMPLYYDIDGNSVDMETWSDLFERKKRTLACDDINCYRVSTVFIGIDMGIGLGGLPLIFETMIFGPEGSKYDLWRELHPNKELALHGHVYSCRLASGEIEEDD